MMMKPASASGCADGSTRSADSGAEPRGSNRHSRRSQSPSRSSQRALSSIVVPGTSRTPPTMMRLGSPSAWASTQWMTLAVRIRATLPGNAGAWGKVAVVTGAGSGIGRATARRFAAEGATVIAADIDLEAARETCEGLPTRHRRAGRRDRRARTSRRCVAGHDHIDVYFNNAGVPARIKPLAELTREEWDRTLDVNLTALFVAAQVVAPKLQPGGLLLVTASIIANRPRPGLSAYVASKAGVVGLAKALATELAPEVRVNVINPGPANTPMLDGFGFDVDPAQALPLKRLIEPEDIAGAAAYLASDDARAITGAVFNVDGGRDL